MALCRTKVTNDIYRRLPTDNAQHEDSAALRQPITSPEWGEYHGTTFVSLVSFENKSFIRFIMPIDVQALIRGLV